MNKPLSLAALSLLLAFVLAAPACRGCQKEEPPAEELAADESAAETARRPDPDPDRPASPVARPSAAPITEPSGKVVAPDIYWAITLERQELTKKHLEKKLAVYQEHGGATPEAREQVKSLMEKDLPREMQALWTSHGLSPRDYWPDRNHPDRDQILQERNTYLQEHPELQQKSRLIARELQQLRGQIRGFEGGPDPRAPRPGEGEQPVRLDPFKMEPITPELYWQIAFEREEINKRHLQKMIETHKKHEGSPESARPEIEELRRTQHIEFNELLQKHKISPAQYYGGDREIEEQRNQYLKERPELQQKKEAQRKELLELRRELIKHIPPPSHAPAPAPDSDEE